MRMEVNEFLLVDTVRAIAIIEAAEPVTSVGRLEDDDMDDLEISDLNNAQIKEVRSQCSLIIEDSVIEHSSERAQSKC